MIKKSCYEFSDEELVVIATCLGSKTLDELPADSLKLAKGIVKKISTVKFMNSVKKWNGAWWYVPKGKLVHIEE